MVTFVEGLALVALAAVLRHAYGAARTQLLKRRQKAPPRVTLLARALNALLWLPSLLKLHEYFGWPLTLAALKRSAERKTRKSAWADRADGKMDYREGYAHAIALLDEPAVLLVEALHEDRDVTEDGGVQHRREEDHRRREELLGRRDRRDVAEADGGARNRRPVERGEVRLPRRHLGERRIGRLDPPRGSAGAHIVEI